MKKKIWRHKNIKESFLGSLRGLISVIKVEKNARIIFCLGIITLFFSLILGLSYYELIIVIIIIISVFICEVFNTLVEYICDMIKPENDPHIKALKDISSGAVLIVCLGAITIGAIIFGPKIISFLRINRLF